VFVSAPDERAIRARLSNLWTIYPAASVFLNPDCGFGTFSNRPMNSEAVAAAKISAMVAAARDLRPVAQV
jgi:5-methyltetrahydropteroyltriglutamate--homocysteine methyltransferase